MQKFAKKIQKRKPFPARDLICNFLQMKQLIFFALISGAVFSAVYIKCKQPLTNPKQVNSVKFKFKIN